MMAIKDFFQQRIAVYVILSVLAGLGVTAGCAKKPLALHPPQVQSTATGAQVGDSSSQTASAAETGGAIGSTAGRQSDRLADVDVKEETLTESEAAAPFSGAENSPDKMVAADTGSASTADGFAASGRGGRADLQVAKMLPFRQTRELDDVHFQFDKHDLDGISKSILQKNAQWLKQHPGVKLEIQGHADERGTNNYNLGLGERRAQSVKKYLMALGVSKDRLFAISYGEEKPFCLKNNENCWWQNRRGHFLVSAPRDNTGEMLGMLP